MSWQHFCGKANGFNCVCFPIVVQRTWQEHVVVRMHMYVNLCIIMSSLKFAKRTTEIYTGKFLKELSDSTILLQKQVLSSQENLYLMFVSSH